MGNILRVGQERSTRTIVVPHVTHWQVSRSGSGSSWTTVHFRDGTHVQLTGDHDRSLVEAIEALVPP